MCRQTGRRLRMVLANLASELNSSSASQQAPVAASICTQPQLQIRDRGHLTIKSCSADPLCRSSEEKAGMEGYDEEGGWGLTMKFPGWVEEVDFIHPQVGWRVEHVIAKWEMLR